MTDRRTASTSLSARIIEYLRRRGHSQVKIARMLGVSEPFISLVKSRERGLTLDHLERLSLALSVPLGALLIAATEPRKGEKRDRDRDERLTHLVRLCDEVTESIMSSPATHASPRRRRAS